MRRIKRFIALIAVAIFTLIIHIVEREKITNQNNVTLVLDSGKERKELQGAQNNIATEKRNQISNLDFWNWSLPPYTPYTHNFFIANLDINNCSKAEFIRNGYGMEEFKEADGRHSWMENGVVYRQRADQNNNTDFTGSSQYEAYIPFNETVFFQGNDAKILRYRYLKAKAAKNKMAAETWQKVILMYQDKWFSQPVPTLQDLTSCPQLPCVFTSNWRYINVSAAMVVNGQYLKSPPPPRRSDQVFVFYNIEPPTHHSIALPRVDHTLGEELDWTAMFNWTMSYRHDADIQTYYGLVRRRPEHLHKNYTAIMEAKSKMAAWIVTNHKTDSNRESYVKELQKYIDVDVYGKGMPNRCPRSFDSYCNEMIGKTYKFYFGFENSFCENYITEKLYKYLGLNLVVVARGINEYTNVIPSEIFVNVNDFETPKDLADHLIHLDENDNEYLEILKQKDKYFAIYEDYPLRNQFLEHRYESVPFCQLCQRLWNMDSYVKTIPDINVWFNQTRCRDGQIYDVT